MTESDNNDLQMDLFSFDEPEMKNDRPEEMKKIDEKYKDIEVW